MPRWVRCYAPMRDSDTPASRSTGGRSSSELHRQSVTPCQVTEHVSQKARTRHSVTSGNRTHEQRVHNPWRLPFRHSHSVVIGGPAIFIPPRELGGHPGKPPYEG